MTLRLICAKKSDDSPYLILNISSLKRNTETGLMLHVALNTFEVKETIHTMKSAVTTKSPQALLDAVALIVTTVLCFKVDMGLGVISGVLISRMGRFVSSLKRRASNFAGMEVFVAAAVMHDIDDEVNVVVYPSS
jgi:hypothetical protein